MPDLRNTEHKIRVLNCMWHFLIQRRNRLNNSEMQAESRYSNDGKMFVHKFFISGKECLTVTISVQTVTDSTKFVVENSESKEYYYRIDVKYIDEVENCSELKDLSYSLNVPEELMTDRLTFVDYTLYTGNAPRALLEYLRTKDSY